jgi:hypothetical protein
MVTLGNVAHGRLQGAPYQHIMYIASFSESFQRIVENPQRDGFSEKPRRVVPMIKLIANEGLLVVP